jgi:hypothetical protein
MSSRLQHRIAQLRAEVIFLFAVAAWLANVAHELAREYSSNQFSPLGVNISLRAWYVSRNSNLPVAEARFFAARTLIRRKRMTKRKESLAIA